MPRWRGTIAVDDYVIDVLLRDITGHDKQPAAFLVYLWLYGQAARRRWRPVRAGLGAIAEATGLSRSAVQSAMARLRDRELIATTREHRTATPGHAVRRHWRDQGNSNLPEATKRRQRSLPRRTWLLGQNSG